VRTNADTVGPPENPEAPTTTIFPADACNTCAHAPHRHTRTVSRRVGHLRRH
jgi:hypothetical protein